jgi:hypothetical protein
LSSKFKVDFARTFRPVLEATFGHGRHDLNYIAGNRHFAAIRVQRVAPDRRAIYMFSELDLQPTPKNMRKLAHAVFRRRTGRRDQSNTNSGLQTERQQNLIS